MVCTAFKKLRTHKSGFKHEQFLVVPVPCSPSSAEVEFAISLDDHHWCWTSYSNWLGLVIFIFFINICTMYNLWLLHICMSNGVCNIAPLLSYFRNDSSVTDGFIFFSSSSGFQFFDKHLICCSIFSQQVTIKEDIQVIKLEDFSRIVGLIGTV